MKTLLKFSFCLIRIWFFFCEAICLLALPKVYSIHVGVEWRFCIEPITSSVEIFKAILHSFSDAVDIEQTRRIFFVACCVDHMRNVYFSRIQQKLNWQFFFLFSPKKKVSSCYDGLAHRYCCVIFCQFTIHQVMFILEYYSCFWMGNWLIFFYRLWKVFRYIINHSDFWRYLWKLNEMKNRCLIV